MIKIPFLSILLSVLTIQFGLGANSVDAEKITRNLLETNFRDEPVKEAPARLKTMVVVLYDILGNEVFSKVIFRDQKDNVMQAIDPYNELNPGVYFIVATSRDEFLNQKLVIR